MFDKYKKILGGILWAGEKENILYSKKVYLNITYIGKDVDYYQNMLFCQST